MAVTKEAEKPTQVLKTAVEGLAVVESSRAVGLLSMPPGVQNKTNVLLGMDSTMLEKITGFGRSVAPLGIGPSMLMKALGGMTRLI